MTELIFCHIALLNTLEKTIKSNKKILPLALQITKFYKVQYFFGDKNFKIMKPKTFGVPYSFIYYDKYK